MKVEHLKAATASSLLRSFPTFIQNELLTDQSFLSEYGISADPILSIEEAGVDIARSSLFDGIRNAFRNDENQSEVECEKGLTWKIEINDKKSNKIFLVGHGKRIRIPDFWPLIPDVDQRRQTFNAVAVAKNLPLTDASAWSETLFEEQPNDYLVSEILSDIGDTPLSFSNSLNSQFISGSSSVDSLVPDSPRYFYRLVGCVNNEYGLNEYVNRVAKSHIEQLLSWRQIDGLFLALLMSSHSLIVSMISIDGFELKNLITVFESLSEKGDRFSQLGTIELGLQNLHNFPELETYIESMIEEILNDSPSEPESQFQLLSSLVMLVDGQMALKRKFADAPPYWRRLASIAHASLIERSIIACQVHKKDFSERALGIRGQLFYLQTLCDLRLEPKWIPDHISAARLKAEFVSRIWLSAQQNMESIQKHPKLFELLLSEHSEIQKHMTFPDAYLPGPLEGGREIGHPLPEELNEMIQKSLAEKRLELSSFVPLINAAIIFQLDNSYADLAARALKEAKHIVAQGEDSSALFPLVSNLAIVAAVTRSREMADELRILLRMPPSKQISPIQRFQIAMISAASCKELNDWCSFVGETLTELAFTTISNDEANTLHSHYVWLLRIAPELWPYMGKAEASLSAFIAK
jgi:hypothetical protein